MEEERLEEVWDMDWVDWTHEEGTEVEEELRRARASEAALAERVKVLEAQAGAAQMALRRVVSNGHFLLDGINEFSSLGDPLRYLGETVDCLDTALTEADATLAALEPRP